MLHGYIFTLLRLCIYMEINQIISGTKLVTHKDLKQKQADNIVFYVFGQLKKKILNFVYKDQMHLLICSIIIFACQIIMVDKLISNCFLNIVIPTTTCMINENFIFVATKTNFVGLASCNQDYCNIVSRLFMMLYL